VKIGVAIESRLKELQDRAAVPITSNENLVVAARASLTPSIE